MQAYTLFCSIEEFDVYLFDEEKITCLVTFFADFFVSYHFLTWTNFCKENLIQLLLA